MIRVFLLDDHALVRTGFRLILGRETDMDVVGEAASGEEALPMIRALKPDVVLCDFHLPAMSGLEVTDRIVRGQPGARVIVVSVQEDGPLPRKLLDAGASGYLPKACPAEELVRAVREVARGRRYLGAAMAQKMVLGNAVGGSPFDVLSPREREVAMMLCRGLRPEDIARSLSLSSKTVATHKVRLLAKLGVDDTVGMVRMAQQYGLLDPH